jgi:predicted phage terminase large subunit-like protein
LSFKDKKHSNGRTSEQLAQTFLKINASRKIQKQKEAEYKASKIAETAVARNLAQEEKEQKAASAVSISMTRAAIDNRSLSDDALRKYAQLMERELAFKRKMAAKAKFLPFVKEMWPGFISGRHHKIMAEKLELVAQGKLKRLIINMPPRHTKSEFASYLFPAWMVGLKPDMKIMQATHTADLSIRFGRKVKNLMETKDYQNIFDVKLRSDSKAAYRWETDDGGEYYASGVGGNIAGRGADLFIVDDPHSEQDAQSPTALENAWDWYTAGPRQRLQPGGAIIIVMTRWGDNDLTARLLKQSAQDPKADQWEVVEFPAIFDNGEALWPEYWKLEELEKIKASIPLAKWNAQYLQKPTSDTASIIKRDWWKPWTKEQVPRLHYVMQSYDTAYLKTRTADFTAIHTWGVFYPNEDSPPNAILLDAKKGRWEFPDLKRIAMEEYKYWEPEVVLIEAKAAGMPLTQELRSSGIPVANFTPSRGNDKHVRMNSVAPLFEAGLVWYPETSWAEEVIEEMASFPYAEHDDHCDAATQALMRFRQGGFLSHPDDFVVEREDHVQKRVYY